MQGLVDVILSSCAFTPLLCRRLADLGSLKGLVDKLGRQSETMTAVITACILSGLQFVHEQGIVHRDIKVRL
jgi:serine/threonine protein kinase